MAASYLRIEIRIRAHGAGAIETIMDGLRWLGLDWDEGPDIPAADSPYIQTERLVVPYLG
ncbi:MAG: hypothetical protein H6669_00105 [Ardenticatenaceae bacterium]|nr:hypothetical protein [Ardenticatenaceae bacterium]